MMSSQHTSQAGNGSGENSWRPEYILFLQHGWADTFRPVLELGKRLVPDFSGENVEIVSPNLGWFRTWWKMKPLVDQIESVAEYYRTQYPGVPWRVVGHSMGGLIWLELLDRHPEWCQHVSFLVLVGCPVGGSDLARVVDPLRVGLGIATDLGTCRRSLAERIAREVPTLSIAGDVGGSHDGTIPVQSTQFLFAGHCVIGGLRHEVLKNHDRVVEVIRSFWSECEEEAILSGPTALDEILQRLQAIRGMTDTNHRGFVRAKFWKSINPQMHLRVWVNSFAVHHVYLTTSGGFCLFAGFVGWGDTKDMYQQLDQVILDFAGSTIQMLE